MIRRRSHPNATLSTRRTEAYTDGVFAIAATLLVLDLTGRGFAGVHTDADLWGALVGMLQPLLTFLISFLILSLMWMTHVAQFEHIARIDATGIWLNNIRLLFIVLVPFTSTVMTDFSDLWLGRILLPVNFFFALLISWLQWWWASRSRAVTMPELTDAEARVQGRAALSALLLSIAVVALSTVVGSFAFFVFALDGPLTRLLRGGAMVVSGGGMDAAGSDDGEDRGPSS